MELSNRKRAVLEAIVKAYIKTGEPVGSKILVGLMENAPSSATLRNEMSELCELGFLEQPHISAGRVPTANAYRIYVNSLIDSAEINDSTKEYIDSLLSQSVLSPEQLNNKAAEILSRLTGLTAFSYTAVDTEVTLKQIEIVKISRHTLMLFVITSDGRTRNRICRIDTPFTDEVREKLLDIFKSRLYRKPLYELNKAYLQNIIASSLFDSFSLVPILTGVFDMADDAAQIRVDIAGQAGMYNVFGEEKARRVLSLMSRSEPIVSICDGIDTNEKVLFGDDTAYNDFKNTTMIVAKYGTSQSMRSRIGIIGSDRMSYEQIIPSVKYMASRLTYMMNEFKKDMED